MSGRRADDPEVEIAIEHGDPVTIPPLDEQASPDPGTEWEGAPAATLRSGEGEADTPQLFTVPTVTRSVSAAFAVISERRGPHWSVSPAEAESIAEPLTGELNDFAEHMPFHGAIAGALGGRRMQLAAAVGIVCGPRLVIDYRLSAQAAREERAAAIERRGRPAAAASPNGHAPGDEYAALFTDIPRPEA